MAPDRYAPSVLYQDAALRIVQVSADPRCEHPNSEGRSYREHAVNACPDPTVTRSLVIERAADTDALGQPIWLPAGALNGAELLRLLETITFDQLRQVRSQPADEPQPRSMICANCGHSASYHFDLHTRCRWVQDVETCPCDAFAPSPPAEPTNEQAPARCQVCGHRAVACRLNGLWRCAGCAMSAASAGQPTQARP